MITRFASIPCLISLASRLQFIASQFSCSPPFTLPLDLFLITVLSWPFLNTFQWPKCLHFNYENNILSYCRNSIGSKHTLMSICTNAHSFSFFDQNFEFLQVSCRIFRIYTIYYSKKLCAIVYFLCIYYVFPSITPKSVYAEKPVKYWRIKLNRLYVFNFTMKYTYMYFLCI